MPGLKRPAVDDPLFLFPASTIAYLIAGWAFGAGHPYVAGVALLSGLCATIAVLASYRRSAKIVRELCGETVGSDRPLNQLLADQAAKLKLLDQRLSQSHPVTGLPTREFLLEAMTRDIAVGKAHCLGAIRFTDFDRIAAFDQAAANGALSAFAQRLVGATRADHVVSQTDRDCVAIWFAHGDRTLIEKEFQAIVHVAGQEISTDQGLISPIIEASAVYFPDDSTDADHLLLRVTAGLQRPDWSRTGELTLNPVSSTESAREQFSLEQDLVQAIAEDQLTMVFQPVVDLAAGRLIGAEALLRWDHPRLGPVSPSRFIPLVESLGLSERYGLWVLNTAVKEARHWHDSGLRNLKVAVNLSARQLLDPDLSAKVMRTLSRHRLAPQSLELELTETAAMADADRTHALFTELRSMGISLAIDDFGAGYSSLSYLKNLPFDKLKIDREFVTNVEARRDSQAICRALIELGRGLDLAVLAEGVETQEEVFALRKLGCRIFQGYYFSKPLAGDAFLTLANDPAWLEHLRGAASNLRVSQ